MENSLVHTAKLVRLIVPDDQGVGTVTGTGIDTQGYDELVVLIDSGVTNTATDFHLEESDALSSGYADITGAAITQITTSNDDTQYIARISLRFAKRYVRGICVVTGTTASIAVMGLLHGGHTEPVTQTNTISFELQND